MISILEKVKDLLEFDSKDDFYFLQIIQRKKETDNLKSNRVIKNYYINSIEHLENRYEEIKTLCKIFNARATFMLNKRSYKKVALISLNHSVKSISNDQYNYVKRCYDKAIGNSSNAVIKKWIIDLDGEITPNYINEMSEVINGLQPEGDKVLKVLPTKNGVHLITTPFNLRDFKNVYPGIEVHKDNFINLFIP